jgi:hypothetical protein
MTTLTGFQADRDGAFIDKDPEATLDYTIDWTNWMPASDTISTSSFAITSPAGDSDPITVDSNSNTNYKATAVLTGGTAGNIYTVTNTIVTTNNITDRRFFRVTVKARSL